MKQAESDLKGVEEAAILIEQNNANLIVSRQINLIQDTLFYQKLD